jgi:hypothetical protein
MRREMGPQRFDVGGATDWVADRVEQDVDVRQTGLAVEAMTELDDLGIDGRTRVADRFDVPLPELAKAAGLRAVVAEHRAEQGDLDRLRPRLEAVLHVGTHDASCRLRSERPALALLAAACTDPEELLLDDIRRRPDATLEDLAALEERRLDRRIAIPTGQVASDRLEALPGRALVRQQVARAPRGAVAGHGCECSERSTPGGRQAADCAGCEASLGRRGLPHPFDSEDATAARPAGADQRQGEMNFAYFSNRPYSADMSPRRLTALTRTFGSAYVQYMIASPVGPST